MNRFCQQTSALRKTSQTIVRRLTKGDEGSIRSSGTGKKEQAQEDMWAHKRDLEHLKDLQKKLKDAHDAVEKQTQKIIEKSSKK